MSSQVEKRPYAKRQPRHVRREQILDAAAELIVAEGWGAMTMDRVAADAGIAKSVIYAIFESQAGLQEKLMQRAQDRAFSLSAEALSATATAGDLGFRDHRRPDDIRARRGRAARHMAPGALPQRRRTRERPRCDP